VERCYDTNPSRKNSNISCYGDFTPDGGTADDAFYEHLKDTGHDYPDGTEFDARQGLEPETIQRAGIRGVVGELWQVGFAVAGLCWLAYLAISPPKSDKPNRSRSLRGARRRQTVSSSASPWASPWASWAGSPTSWSRSLPRSCRQLPPAGDAWHARSRRCRAALRATTGNSRRAALPSMVRPWRTVSPGRPWQR
jgi:hypothetical protein